MIDAANPAVSTERIGKVLRLTMNRPAKMNPLTPRCVREILAQVAQAEADAEIHSIIIRGSGKAFSSGYGSIPEDAEPGDSDGRSTIQQDVTAMECLGLCWAQVWNCRIPVIAQVHGYCLAGGTDLALHCDIVVAGTSAKIGFPPVRSMGAPPTNMWLYHAGPQMAKRLLLTGDTLTGSEAAACGLAVAVVDDADLDAYALHLATRIAAIGRDLLMANKRVINLGVELMGRSVLQYVAATHDAIAHLAPEARAYATRVSEIGLGAAARERDVRFDG